VLLDVSAFWVHITVDATIAISVRLEEAGRPGAIGDAHQRRLGRHLDQLTNGDRSVPIVTFCYSAACPAAYNGSLRAKALGYENVYWYRGGRLSWKTANLPLGNSHWLMD
jgi:rhodanese-related sulfurtransferase